MDLLVVARYLHRPHFAMFASLLTPNGLLLFHTFLVGAECVGRRTPTRPRFLVRVLVRAVPGWCLTSRAAKCWRAARVIRGVI